jgi:hypothetical protein
MIFRLVGGTDIKPTAATAGANVGSNNSTSFRLIADRPSTETAKNGKLREQRKNAWRAAEAATR